MLVRVGSVVMKSHQLAAVIHYWSSGRAGHRVSLIFESCFIFIEFGKSQVCIFNCVSARMMAEKKYLPARDLGRIKMNLIMAA